MPLYPNFSVVYLLPEVYLNLKALNDNKLFCLFKKLWYFVGEQNVLVLCFGFYKTVTYRSPKAHFKVNLTHFCAIKAVNGLVFRLYFNS